MNEQNKKMELLGNAPMPKALVSLGIPIMIGMLINALYNLVDAYFVGGLGESPMGGNFYCVSSRTGCRWTGLDVWKWRSFLSVTIIRKWRPKKQRILLPVQLFTVVF